MIDKLYFIGSMDLGDCFVYAGIVNYYADRCKQLHVPVKPSNYQTLSTLFSEHPNIKVVAMESADEEQYIDHHKLSKVITDWDLYLTTVGGFRCSVLWDEQIYTNFEIPFGYRYSNFRLPKTIDGSKELYDRLYKGRPYALIHRRTSHYPDGMPIDIEKYRENIELPSIDIIEIEPGITDNLLHYVKLIENATEIHCVSSSFYCLVDSIHSQTCADLYFHDVRASSIERVNNRWNNSCWKIVNYPFRM
jgi:hypothetical protein